MSKSSDHKPSDHQKRTRGIREVARVARVSPATVSRVLNGSTTVMEDNRKRVLDAVARTGYQPNRLARNLRLLNAETIGVVVPDIANPHFSAIVRIIEAAAYQAGYRVLLCNTDETPAKQRTYLEVLAGERVLGVIISSADRTGTGLNALLDIGIPVVCIDRPVDRADVDIVACNNDEGVRRLTEHVIWLGHERIAYLGGRRDLQVGAERLKGYTAAMRSAGLVPFTSNGGFQIDTADKATERLLHVSRRPTALVIANNLMTIGALRAIHRAGLAVPSDLALVAVDDPPWAALIDPPLTTLAQPIDSMADTAISMLLERIEGSRTEVRRVELPLELHIRASCGIESTTSREGSS